MKIGRDLLEIKVVFFVAMGATRVVEALALCLLRGERGLDVTTGGDHQCASCERQARNHRRSQL